MSEDDIRGLFAPKIAAARWLERNGNARATHAAKMVRYALESALADVIRLNAEPVSAHHNILCAPAPYLVAEAA